MGAFYFFEIPLPKEIILGGIQPSIDNILLGLAESIFPGEKRRFAYEKGRGFRTINGTKSKASIGEFIEDELLDDAFLKLGEIKDTKLIGEGVWRQAVMHLQWIQENRNGGDNYAATTFGGMDYPEFKVYWSNFPQSGLPINIAEFIRNETYDRRWLRLTPDAEYSKLLADHNLSLLVAAFPLFLGKGSYLIGYSEHEHTLTYFGKSDLHHVLESAASGAPCSGLFIVSPEYVDKEGNLVLSGMDEFSGMPILNAKIKQGEKLELQHPLTLNYVTEHLYRPAQKLFSQPL